VKTSLYGVMRYFGQRGSGGWPEPPKFYDRDVGQRHFQDNLEECVIGDELGYDWVSFSEHHYTGGTMSGVPMLLGTSVAALTKRIKIAMVGPHMPLNNPIRVAEELATLDNLAGGRLVVGLLRGTPNEFQVYGVNPTETRELATEGMELVIKAWTEPEPFGWAGRHYNFRTVSVWPRTFQRPHPPVYVLGNSAETCEFAAKHHLGIGVSFGTFAVNGRSTAYFREQAEANGWTPDPEQIIYRGTIYLAESDAQAEDYYRSLESVVSRMQSAAKPGVRDVVARLDPNPFHTGGAPLPGRTDHLEAPLIGGVILPNFCGSPDTVLRQIKECQEATGAGVLDLNFHAVGLDHSGVLKQIRMFAKEVMPAVKGL
jgi:alkanesulfonate monooxygenase SsuD/methylene tetrahydromethanopterin reductase-like flavin-dependent oxidoreductase (luciferase family)